MSVQLSPPSLDVNLGSRDAFVFFTSSRMQLNSLDVNETRDHAIHLSITATAKKHLVQLPPPRGGYGFAGICFSV